MTELNVQKIEITVNGSRKGGNVLKKITIDRQLIDMLFVRDTNRRGETQRNKQ